MRQDPEEEGTMACSGRTEVFVSHNEYQALVALKKHYDASVAETKKAESELQSLRKHIAEMVAQQRDKQQKSDYFKRGA